ncbi:hypothetical protein [Hymenobacter sp. BRD67]|uniref:hypothetical protein n=1 Tax=Hymenobacter sp. BRD67 TaxID=2675877 RepID=UPI001567C400|nr:hypothetical protein [Hymenobacter sp. BRD67]QKG52543.1 hypothetical protein GKZ67_07955 [Hymenobacter sp. BRD67]
MQQRLAALAEAERLDTRFRSGLEGHASQPRRELWERLEDEHLRPQPRRRRPIMAWWYYAAAVVVLLLAGGAGLWGGYFRLPGHELAARRAGGQQPLELAQKQLSNQQTISDIFSAKAEKKQAISSGQATASSLSSSSHPIATTTRLRRAATAHRVASSHHLQTRRPDAATGALATARGRTTPASQLSPTPHEPAATAVAPAAQATNPPLVVAAVAGPVTPAATPEIIEVEVRRGPEPAGTSAPVVVAAHSAPARPRLRLGGLLRQANHLVHGEAVSLAEATGLPESLTVQARLGGRVLSRTIQL